MGVLIRKQKGAFIFTGIARLAIITLIISFGAAFIDTIWAVYLEGLLGNISLVSFLSAFLTIIAFFSSFFLIPVIEKNNKSKLLAISLFFIAIIYILFAVFRNIWMFIILSIILTILTTLRISSMGIIIRDKSQKKEVARNEGLMYTFFNIAWVLGPLLAGYISQAYGIPLIFILAGIFTFVAFLVFKISRINNANIKKKIDGNVLKNFLSFFKDRNRRLAYIIGGGVNFWLILIYLYMPIYIIHQGLNEIWIGYFLFAVAVPTILFEYLFCKLAGKIGFKKIFKLGFIILSLAALLCFIFYNVYIILIILVIAGIGISMIEPTTEAYFFDILKNKEEESKYYSSYNTTIDSNYFTGKVLAGILLLFAPFRFVFLFFSIAMFIYFLICFKLKEVRECLRGRCGR